MKRDPILRLEEEMIKKVSQTKQTRKSLKKIDYKYKKAGLKQLMIHIQIVNPC